jgi:hypothetical protein
MSTITNAPPVAPPKSWFSNPNLNAVTPITVTKEGRVFGHIASFSSCHTESTALGEACVRAPRSRNDYADFHLGTLTTEEGDDVAVGHIVAGAPHADPVWGLDSTLVHYSHSGWVGADVRAGEDRYGVWVSGALRPDISPSQLRALKASPLSGDWRTDPSTQALELVAVLAVNAPGFRVPRPHALIASNGFVQSIIAVGAVGPDIVTASRRREVKLKAIGFRMDDIRRGTGVPVPRTKPRPTPRRNVAELAAIVADIRESALIASMSASTAKVQPWTGVIGAERQLTGDNRLIAADALEWAPFPLPLRWAPVDNGGHDGAVVVGKIDSISRGDDGVIHASGVIDLGSTAGQEVARQIRAGFAGGISLDLDSVDSTEAPVTTAGKTGSTTQPALVTKEGRVRAATLVAIPAFHSAKISLNGQPTNPPPPLRAADSGADFTQSYAADDCGCANPQAPHE